MRRHLQRRRRRNPSAALRKRATIFAALALAGALAYWGPDAWDRVRYGAKLGPDAPTGAPLEAAPQVLAAAAGLPVDVYTLGRVIRSEAGSGPRAEQIAVAWVVRNAARESGVSVTDKATSGSAATRGRYGAQNLAGGRYVSTRRAPRASDIDIALGIFNGQISDNTGGAVNFFHPGAQAAAVASGVANYSASAQDFINNRAREGKLPRRVAGAPRLIVFVKTGGGISGLLA